MNHSSVCVIAFLFLFEANENGRQWIFWIHKRENIQLRLVTSLKSQAHFSRGPCLRHRPNGNSFDGCGTDHRRLRALKNSKSCWLTSLLAINNDDVHFAGM